MTILALDSSGMTAGVALYQDGKILAEYSVNHKKTHSQTLLPMVDEIMRMTETEKTALDAVAVAAGPGSFTGLRIGSATAKGLGLALQIPLLAVPTLEGLAYRYYGWEQMICPMMDARRKQVYTGIYTFAEKQFQIVHKQEAIALDVCIDRINHIGKPTVFLGDAVSVYEEELKEKVTVPYQIAPPHKALQSAAAVAFRGSQLYENGQTIPAQDFAPEYLRVSQAERERAQRLKEQADKME